MYAVVLDLKEKSVLVRNIESEKLSYLLIPKEGLEIGDTLQVNIVKSFWKNGLTFFQAGFTKLNDEAHHFERCLKCGAPLKRNDLPLCYNCWHALTYSQKKDFEKNAPQTPQNAYPRKKEFVAVPNSSPQEPDTKKIRIYQAVMEQAFEDGILTDDEKNLLQTLRKSLGISEQLHGEIQARVIRMKKEEIENARAIIQQKLTGDKLEDNFRTEFPLKYLTEDGHFVRSRGEKMIDDFLYRHNIPHAYEKKLRVGSETLYSDFYIPIGKKCYIEYWGLEDKRYAKRRRKKVEIYRKYKYNLVEIENRDIDRLPDVLPHKLIPYLPENFRFE